MRAQAASSSRMRSAVSVADGQTFPPWVRISISSRVAPTPRSSLSHFALGFDGAAGDLFFLLTAGGEQGGGGEKKAQAHHRSLTPGGSLSPAGEAGRFCLSTRDQDLHRNARQTIAGEGRLNPLLTEITPNPSHTFHGGRAMSVCYRLVLDSVCRSNHHRLAVMALEHLQSADAESWRNVFLKHRDAYLEGAKAPDEVFKDFRNHVLHVRDGDWGGAPAAAREWYRRTVRAMRAQDWKHAAYCAGVMSHYVVDPVQPFHTHQTEEEGTIHRAVEWSLSKAFPEMLLILTQDLGFPDVPVPEGETWLEQMVKAGGTGFQQALRDADRSL